jgi:hypothetical protein
VLLLLLLQITHLFKDVLHGNGRFVMVVNVSPAAEEFNETKRVLQVRTDKEWTNPVLSVKDSASTLSTKNATGIDGRLGGCDRPRTRPEKLVQ